MWLRILRGLHASLLGFSVVAATAPTGATAQIVKPVPGGASAPSLGMTANGTPIVNINKPNAAGVSNNSYTSYNVGQSNLILNNSTGIVTTTTGGTISGNANLGGTSARVIVNQVIANNPSLLAGYTEVAGQSAQVVVANPYGITCSGCGFLNSGRVTLTTGTPVFNAAGGIASYQVTDGTLAIQGLGLDATRVTTLDLFARAIEVNAGIWANAGNLVYGAGSIDATNGTVTTITGHTPPPTFGLDQSALGGMYGGTWTLVGTEAGLGVNMAGSTQASSGAVTLSAAGQVSVSGQVYAAGAINFTAGDAIHVSGTLYGTTGATVTATSTIGISGTIASQGNVSLQGAGASLSGLAAAGMGADGTLSGSGTLAITSSGSTTITGQAVASGAVSVAGSDISVTGSTDANGHAQGVIQGATVALSATGTTGITSSGQVLATTGPVTVSTAGALNNSGLLQSAADLGVTAGSVANSGTFQAGGSSILTATSGDVTNSGTLYAGGTQTVTTPGTLTNAPGAVIKSGGAANLSAASIVNGTGATVRSGTDTTVVAGSLSNVGTFYAGGGQTQTVTGAISNTGEIAAYGNTSLSAASLSSSGTLAAGLDAGGAVSGSGNLTSTTTGVTTISGGALAGGTLTITGNPVTFASGASVEAPSIALNLGSGDVSNAGRLHATAAPLTLNLAGTLTNTGALIAPGISITAGQIDNDSGTLAAGTLDANGNLIAGAGDLTASISGMLSNRAGTLEAGGGLNLHAGSLDNTSGLIATTGTNAPGQAVVAVGGAIVNAGGTIGSNGALAVTGTSVDLGTNGTLIAQGGGLTVHATAGAITAGSQSTISSAQALRVTATGDVTLGGQTQAGTDASITGNTVSNSGTVYAGAGQGAGSLSVTATAAPSSGSASSAITNSGTLAAFGNVTLSGASLSSSGTLAAGLKSDGSQNTAGDLTSTTSGATTISGQVVAPGTLSIIGNPLSLSANLQAPIITLNAGSGGISSTGQVVAKSGLTVFTTGALTNSSVLTAPTVSLTASSLTNDHATIAAGTFDAGGNLVAGSGTLTATTSGAASNQGGTLESGNTLNLSAGSLNSNAGTILALGTSSGTGALAPLYLSIAGALSNQGGGIGSGSNITLSTGSYDGSLGGKVTAPGTVAITASSGNVSVAGGGIVTAQTVNLTANNGTIDASTGGSNTRGGLIQASQSANLSSLALNSSGGLVEAPNLGITTTSITNSNGGQILFLGTSPATVSVGGAVNNNGGTIASNGSAFTLSAGSLSNQGGTLQQAGTGTFALTITGQLDNSASGSNVGKILSNGAINLSAGDLSNNGGLIAAPGNVLVTTTDSSQVLDNTGGAILAGMPSQSGGAIQASGLTLHAAGGITNTGGTLEAGDSLTLTGTSLSNGGKILGYGTGASTVTLSGAFDNGAGQVGTPGALTITASSISNNTGGMIFTGDGTNAGKLTLNAGSLTNGGTIQSGADLKLAVTGAITNQGGTLSAIQAVDIDPTDLDNRGGTITGGAQGLSLTISGLIDNSQGGKIGATGAVTLGAGTLNNQTGTIASGSGQDLSLTITGQADNSNGGKLYGGRDLNLNAGSIANTNGSIGASRNIVLTSGGNVANTGGGTITATNGTVTVNAGAGTIDTTNGTITGSDVTLTFAGLSGLATSTVNGKAVSNVSAPGTLTLNATQSFDNAAGQTILGAGNLVLTSAGALSNEGTITAAGATTVTGTSITNTGAIFGGTVTVNAGSGTGATPALVNSGANAVIGAVSNLAINTNGDIQNLDGAYLYSQGGIGIAGAGGSGAANSLLNSSATIQADGDVTIAANTITNKRTILTYTVSGGSSINEGIGALYTPIPQNLIAVSYCDLTGCPQENILYYVGGSTTITGDSGQALIVSGGNLTLNAASQVTNAYSRLSAAGNITINGGGIASTTSSTTAGVFNNISLAANGYGLMVVEIADDSNYSPPYIVSLVQDVFDPNDPYLSPTQQATAAFLLALPRTNPPPTASGTAASAPAIVAAGGAVSITAKTINNQNLDAAGAATVGTSVGAPQQSVLTASATASNVTSASGSTASATVNGQAVATAGTTTGAIATASGGLATSALAGSIFTVPTGGLFVPVSTPGAHYLVAINSAFPGNPNTVSSDLYLTALGYDPTRVEQRLGDGQYEQQLVAQQLIALTGVPRLATYASNTDQYTALLAAGAQYAQEYNLGLGVGLSADQMASLTSNIVLMVSETVQTASGPQDVLVPAVYLAPGQATNLAAAGASIGGGSVNLAAGDLSNSGTIKAAQNGTITATGNILNTGLISTGGVGVITAGGNIAGQGGSITGGSLNLSAGGDLTVTSVTQTRITVDGINTTLLAGAGITASGPLSVSAGGTITTAGASFASGAGLTLSAQTIALGTVGLASGSSAMSLSPGGVTFTGTQTTSNMGTSITGQGPLTVIAGGNLSITGSNLSGNTVTALAGGTMTVANSTGTTSSYNDSLTPTSQSFQTTSQQNIEAAAITGTGSVTLAAGLNGANGGAGSGAGSGSAPGSLSVIGSNVTSNTGAVTLAATGDVNVNAATAAANQTSDRLSKRLGMFSSTTVTTHDQVDTSTQVASNISGNTITTRSGGDTTVTASNFAATNALNMAAVGAINVLAGTNTDTEEHDYAKKTTGLFGAGIGVTIGQEKLSTADTISQTTAAASTVGATNGNVTIAANDNVHVQGSDVIAGGGGDVSITGNNVTIDAAQSTRTETQTMHQSSSGLTVALTGGVISAAQGISGAVSAATSSKDSRVQALQGLAAAGNAVTAGLETPGTLNGLSALANNGNISDASKASGIGVSISIGGSSAKSSSTSTTVTQTGSTISGNNVTIAATGTGSDGTLKVVGSNIGSADTAVLTGNSVALAASRSTSSSSSRNSSSSGSLGVTVGGGGVSVGANVAAAHGNADSNSSTHTNTTVTAGNLAVIASTGDTTLNGAQVKANQVVADVGGNLSITSPQDTSTEHVHQESMSLGISVPIAGAGGSIDPKSGPGGGVNLSISSTTGDSSYASVTTPSGLLAGDGGYQVTVGGNTSLVGGLITSSQKAANNNLNSLTTGTLTTQDVQNSASYSVSSSGFSGGTSAGSFIPGYGVPVFINEGGNQASTTTSGITQNASGGTITISNQAGQAATGKTADQVIASLAANSQGLTTDTAQASANALSNNPNVAAEVSNLQDVQATAASAASAVVGAVNIVKAEQDSSSEQNKDSQNVDVKSNEASESSNIPPDTGSGAGGPQSIDMKHGYQPPANPQIGSPNAAASNATQAAIGVNEFGGYCAEWVINALNAAGYDVPMTDAAYAGPNLQAAGFSPIGTQTISPGNRDALPDGYTPVTGDVVVEVGSGKQHIAIYNGSAWVSDTIQSHISPYPHATVTATFYRGH